MKKFLTYTLSLAFVSFTIANDIEGFQNYNISTDKAIEIQDRLSTMSETELAARKSFLDNERDILESQRSSSQNPLTVKELTEKIEEIDAENNYIALLLGLAVVGAIGSSLESDNPDLTKPVITIAGNNPATVELGSTYTDAGASAVDDSGSVTVRSVGISSVNTNIVGTYTVTYFATDSSGNTATATRTVNVVDTTAPVITLTGSATVDVELGSSYVDAGATVSDLSGSITPSVSGSVDTDTVGTYTITYSASDASGNEAVTVSRTVTVIDTTAPVITSSDTFVADENQTAIGTVTATDLQTVTFSVSGTELQITSGGVLTFVTAPDYETKSVYTATVTATDASLNSSTQDITVNVNDVGGIDDDPGTGTGTSTSSGTGTGTGT
jgi:hypothetical protein